MTEVIVVQGGDGTFHSLALRGVELDPATGAVEPTPRLRAQVERFCRRVLDSPDRAAKLVCVPVQLRLGDGAAAMRVKHDADYCARSVTEVAFICMCVFAIR